MLENKKIEYEEPCLGKCLEHKYHCSNCNTACSYSPANYCSRPEDIPNPCRYCYLKNYERDHSHTHCWNQTGDNTPACGQPLEKHEQCCLCDTPAPEKKKGWEEKEKTYNVNEVYQINHGYSLCEHCKIPIFEIISQSIATAHREERNSIIEKMRSINKEGTFHIREEVFSLLHSLESFLQDNPELK